MSHDKDMEQALANLSWDVPAEVDRRILDDISQVSNDSDSVHSCTPVVRSYRRKITVAAAGALATAAVLAFALFAMRSSITLADVQTAFLEQAWVHLKYDDGAEEWVSLDDGTTAIVRVWPESGERCFVGYVDRVGGYNYFQHFRETKITKVKLSEPKGYSSGWKPQTEWEFVISPFERSVEGKSRPYSTDERDVQRSIETLDGRKLVRFDVYCENALGERYLAKQIWADLNTRLPLRVREKLSVNARFNTRAEGLFPADREWRTGEYSFPEEGPTSIYDLGVPSKYPVVAPRKRVTPSDDVKDILDACWKARDRWPQRWRLATWHMNTDIDPVVDIIYWDGKPNWDPRSIDGWNGVKVCQLRYLRASRNNPFPSPASGEKVWQWAITETDRYINLSDGERVFSQYGPHPDHWKNKPEFHVSVTSVHSALGFPPSSWPTDYLWPLARRDSQCKIVTGSERKPGLVLVRREYDGVRTDYHIDPARDHICIKKTRWVFKDNDWRKKREEELLELKQLPGGQWYCSRRREGSEFKGNWNEEVWEVAVEVMEPDDFPPNIFNGEKLMEDARKLGATVESD